MAKQVTTNLDAIHRQILLQALNDPRFSRNYVRSLKARHIDTFNYIDDRYPQLVGHSFSEKCYWLINGYADFPKCKLCGKPVTCYQNITKGYVQTCSASCGNRYKVLRYQQSPMFSPSEDLDIKFYDELQKMHLNLHSNKFVTQMINNAPCIWNYVWFRYALLEGHPMTEKLYWFLNKMTDFPACCICHKKDLHFINVVVGYSKHCDGCQYDDPDYGKSISLSYHKHKKSDPLFRDMINQKRAATNIKNGHDPHWNNSKQAKATVQQHLENDPDWLKKRSQKGKTTNELKHGHENYNNLEQHRQTCLRLYGVDSFSKTQEFIEKTKTTNQKNFGADFAMQSELGVSRFKQSMQKNHGVDWPSQIPEYRERWKNDKAFVERRQEKMYETKRKNGTFNASKLEDASYRILCEAFGEDDVHRQHKDEQYPYMCDFYIKSKELYIECNYHWTHCCHWFDANNEDDLKHLEYLQQKDLEKKNIGNIKNQYANAIYVWTQLDIKKRDTAIKNKIKYVVFWKLTDLIEHLNQLKM